MKKQYNSTRVRQLVEMDTSYNLNIYKLAMPCDPNISPIENSFSEINRVRVRFIATRVVLHRINVP